MFGTVSGSKIGGPVYIDDGSGHEFSPFRSEEEYGMGDLVRPGNAIEGALTADFIALLAGQFVSCHIRLDEAGGNDTD